MLYASVRSVIRSNRTAEPPLRIPAGPEQYLRIEALQREIAADLPDAHLSTWGEQKSLIVPVDLRDSDAAYARYGGSAHVYVFFSGEELRVAPTYGSEGTPLSGAPHLLCIVAALRERMREQRGRAQKRTKIRKLQQRSLRAQVEATTARLGVACELTCTPAEARLFVRFGPWNPHGPRNGLTVLVPYAHAEEVLSGLGPLIEAARELYRRGAACKAVFHVGVAEYPDPAAMRRTRRVDRSRRALIRSVA